MFDKLTKSDNIKSDTLNLWHWTSGSDGPDIT